MREILTWPDKAPVAAIQAKLDKVYEYNQRDTKYGKKSIQNFVLRDASGATIRCAIWEHPDLKEHEGKEYVFDGGSKGNGIVVKLGTYRDKPTVELSLGKASRLQWVEVYHDKNPGQRPVVAAPSPAKASITTTDGRDAPMAVGVGLVPLNGSKVGMALNNAVLLLTSDIGMGRDDDSPIEAVKRIAVEIIRLSNDLESGKIRIDPIDPLPAMRAQAEKEVKQSEAQEIADDDIPF